MRLQDGTISSGRFSTACVVGEYWMSCTRSFWNTTLPGDAATSSPILNAWRPAVLVVSLLRPRSRSDSRLLNPRSRFSPPVSTVLRSTSGLVIRKLAGLIASMNWRE